MIVYILNLFISTILNFFARITKKKNIKASIIIGAFAILIPILVCGLRYNVGTDYISYQQWFSYYLSHKLSLKNDEIGFGILIKGIQLFTQNSQFLFLSVAIIINILVINFIRKHTDYFELGYFLFISLYFYYSSFNILRQWIAIAIFLYAIRYIYNKDLKKYLFCIFIACTFHKTAIITIPMYFILNMKLNKKNIIIVSLTILMLYVGLDTILLKANSIFNINTTKYLNYFNKDDTIGANGYAYSIITMMTLLIILFTKKQYLLKNEHGKEDIIMLVFMLAFSIMGINSMIFSRLQLYFLPYLAVIIPNMLKVVIENQRKFIYVIVIILGIAYMYRSLTINGGQILPYQSILTKI